MKAYLITTGLIFGLMAVVHIARLFAEWPPARVGPEFVAGAAALIILPAVFAWWAWRVLRTLPARKSD